ncbi:MAG: hypothetical protein M1829_003442 [Trizodia sp. TS-e1964]|nr:MAG: hypothetical protein M1829_003442 [Trizodia sp. TS-e1964]
MSALESVPVEVLHHIFLLSKNCNLPLASSRLRSALSDESLPKRMVISVLESGDIAAQRALFERRFFDLAIYDDAAYLFYSQETKGPLKPQGATGQSTLWDLTANRSLAPSWRLIRDLRVEPKHDVLRGKGPLNYSERLWKIELLLELYPFSFEANVIKRDMNIHLDHVLDTLVTNGDSRAVSGILFLFYIPLGGLRVPYDVMWIAICDNACKDPEIVWQLCKYARDISGYTREVDADLASWAKNRIDTDRKARVLARKSGEAVTASHPVRDYWIGLWVTHLMKQVYGNGPAVDRYDEFFERITEMQRASNGPS